MLQKKKLTKNLLENNVFELNLHNVHQAHENQLLEITDTVNLSSN